MFKLLQLGADKGRNAGQGIAQLRGVLAAALMGIYGARVDGNCREMAENISKNLTKVQIMRTIELLQKYHGECVYNVGSGHVLGALAAELEGIL